MPASCSVVVNNLIVKAKRQVFIPKIKISGQRKEIQNIFVKEINYVAIIYYICDIL